MQTVRMLSIVHGTQVESAQPEEKEELLSCCFCDGVYMVGPGLH